MNKYLGIGLVVLSLAACNNQSPDVKKAAAPAAASASAEVAGVVARVGDHVFTEADIDAELQHMPGQVRALSQQPSMRTNMLQNLISRYTLLERAKAMGINDDPVVKARIEMVVNNMLIQALNEKMRTQLNPKEDDVRRYYDEHQQQYQTPARWHIRHILLNDEHTAQQVLQQLQRGADFAELAAKVSQDAASSQRGGELEPFVHGHMGPEIEQALQTLSAENPLSGVVKTRFGYHIIRFLSDEPAGVRPFDEVKAQLTTQFQQQYFRDWVISVKDEAKVEILKADYRLPDVRSPIKPPNPQLGG